MTTLQSEFCDGCGTEFDYTVSVDKEDRETEEFVIPIELPCGNYCSEKCVRR
jgi:hypothetical protein